MFLITHPDTFHPGKFKTPGALSVEINKSPNNPYKEGMKQERIAIENNKEISHSKT